jgi:hypothetical protein
VLLKPLCRLAAPTIPPGQLAMLFSQRLTPEDKQGLIAEWQRMYEGPRRPRIAILKSMRLFSWLEDGAGI